jgi:CubicO group peptidase (beta-lactamase class C family)
MLSWSMAKSVNSILLGHLEMQGLANVHDSHLFPEWENDGRANITLENLLHMTDGLDYEETYDPGDPAVDMLFESPSMANYMLGRKAVIEPGLEYNYSSGTALLITHLIQQKIAGDIQADSEFLVNEFFRPLGMASVTYETDAVGLYQGSSYLYATARDWAKVGQLMLNGGEINGHRLVTEDYVKRSLTPNHSYNRTGYGYQWWLNTDPDRRQWPDLPSDTFGARGDREQRLVVIPDTDLVIVRLGWSENKYIGNDNFSEIRSWFW